jgi:hypothetical protein
MNEAAKNYEVFTAFAPTMHAFSDKVSRCLSCIGPASDPALQNKHNHKYLFETSQQQAKWPLIALLSETNKSEGK